MLTANSRF